MGRPCNADGTLIDEDEEEMTPTTPDKSAPEKGMPREIYVSPFGEEEEPAPAVDLSKAQAGDTVKFRCGGEAEIQAITFGTGECHEAEIRIAFAWTKYFNDGSFHREPHPFDIIAIEPKPFDWKDVKPGMAFTREGREGVFIFVGIAKGEHAGSYIFELPASDDWSYDSWPFEGLYYFSRAPEHDITPKAGA